MNPKKRWLIFSLALCLLLALAVGMASAETSGYTMSRWVVADGGGTSQGGGYHLNGTIGQPDAGQLSGGRYRLSGGFWGGGASNASVPNHVYLPILVR